MYEFYVLYLHVDLERQWLKCEIILLNLYRQHYWGIQPKNNGIYQMKWFVWHSTQTKYISFGLDFTISLACVSDESEDDSKPNVIPW